MACQKSATQPISCMRMVLRGAERAQFPKCMYVLILGVQVGCRIWEYGYLMHKTLGQKWLKMRLFVRMVEHELVASLE